MASFKYDKADRKAVIQFHDRTRRRRTVRLSGVSRSFAERFHSVIERLNEARCTGSTVDSHVTAYLADLSDVYFDKLVRVDLVEPRPVEAADTDSGDDTEPVVRLGEFLSDYMSRRTDLKKSSLLVYRNVERDLLRFFRADMPIADITHGHVVDFGRHLKRRKLAPPTIDRRISLAVTIFNDAVNYQWIERNPFVGFRKSLKGIVSSHTSSRKHTVNREDILRVLDQCPDAEWRCLVALSRFGGLRVPSEALSLKWDHIDWARNVMSVPVPKLEHLPGHEMREVPNFGELLPFLLECSEQAEDGAVYVIERHRPPVLKSGAGWAHANLRKAFKAIVQKAGLEPWPHLFHNMRASRQNELQDEFAPHVVCAWLGNSEDVAKRHYLKVTPQHVERAINRQPLQSVMPQVMPHGADSARTEPRAANGTSSPCAANEVLRISWTVEILRG